MLWIIVVSESRLTIMSNVGEVDVPWSSGGAGFRTSDEDIDFNNMILEEQIIKQTDL